MSIGPVRGAISGAVCYVRPLLPFWTLFIPALFFTFLTSAPTTY